MPSSSVEQIKERLRIEDVIGGYVKLERAGASLKARCPFHSEKTPSFFVSPERGGYYCFGCGAKGDIFTFVERFENVDFVGALKILAERAGVTLERFSEKTDDGRSRLYALLEAATFFLERNLSGEDIPLEYLKNRGLTEKTIKDWRLGYVRDEWRSISDYLSGKGFSDDEIMRAGITKTEKGSTYDRFRGRIMFPIFDAAGRTIAFSGRIMHDDGKSAKYLNSPQTELFDKSKVLYGYDRAKQPIRKFDFSILVEGQMDLLLAHQAGFTNTVAVSGTALTADHLALLRRITPKIIMTFDGDRAGAKAAERGWALALASGMEVKIAALPDGLDPADVILKDREIFKSALVHAVHLVDFLLGRIEAEKLDAKKLWTRIRSDVLPYIAMLASETEKARYVGTIADIVGAKEEFIWDDLKKVKLDAEFVREKPEPDALEKSLDGSVLKRGSPERSLAGIIAEGSAGAKEILKKVKEILDTETGAAFERELDAGKNELAFEAEAYFGGFPAEKMRRETELLLLTIAEEAANRERVRLANDIAKTKDEEKKNSLMIRSMELGKRVEGIKRDKKKFL
ncbi:MAG: DNA primase [Patescibacteria group bacterium]|nr:DNA primase [Patescibacteria group bacterium]MDE1945877.1 DNA primase [Patescibacteria group bacterium]